MTRIPLLFAATLLAFASVAPAADSLLDTTRTKPLTRAQQAAFGPRSGGLRYDPRMIRATQIAKRRANPKMTWKCWKYVKNALVAASVISSRPTSLWANQAGTELCRDYGFRKLAITNPYEAPVGAVVVYHGEDGGHVELRTEEGFVSDFVSRSAYPRPLLGVFVKPS